MSDNKKYYYLKLKENFFETDELRILESMENGYMYSNLLLKLYLKSIKFEGKLRLNEYIPYNTKMIATITNLNVDTVTAGLKILEQLKLIDVLADGTIYMTQIQNFIGQSSTEADRKRNYRNKIESEKENLLTEGQTVGQNVDKCPKKVDKNPPEIELEIEKDIDIKKDTVKDKKVIKNIGYTKEFLEWYELYPNPWNKSQSFKNFKTLMKNETFENLILATKNYINYIKKKGTSKEFIVRSTNFIGQHQEYKGYLEMQQDIKTNPIEQAVQRANAGAYQMI